MSIIKLTLYGHIKTAEQLTVIQQYTFIPGMLIDGVRITPVKSVHDLGICIDADLSMRMHVQKTVSCCFAALRQLRQSRRYVPTSTF